MFFFGPLSKSVSLVSVKPSALACSLALLGTDCSNPLAELAAACSFCAGS
jgi:hypothetical protein